MGLDSNLSSTGAGAPVTHAPEARDLAPRATTASMQSLLAQYFADQDAGGGETMSSSPVHDSQAAILAALSPEPPASAAPATVLPEPQPDARLKSQPDAFWPQAARDEISRLRTELAEARRQLAETHAQLERQVLLLQSAQAQADRDVLTPTLNRRAFLREVQRAMADCRRYGEEATLIYTDMDGFKAINDAYGHAAGDAALIYVAEALNANVREGDSVGRMGGDEFAILLRHADLKSARIKAMKLEAELMMGTFEYNGLYLKTGGSFGVRAYAGQASAEAWLSEADAAMFLVKKSSR